MRVAGLAQEHAREGQDELLAQQLVGLGVGILRGAGCLVVKPRGERHASSRQRQSLVAGQQHGRDDQSAACRVAGERHARGLDSLVEQPAVGGDDVLDGGRVDVLGGPAVVHSKNADADGFR